MASKASIAMRRNDAIDRIATSIRTIWGEGFELPRRHRDITMLGAIQMEAIADFLEDKATQPESFDYAAMKLTDLKAAARARGIPFDASAKKEQVVALLAQQDADEAQV